MNPKDLEWLAWNWRAWKNQNLFKSRVLMVFSCISYEFSYLPSPQEILYGIVLAQIDHIKNENPDFIQNYASQ